MVFRSTIQNAPRKTMKTTLSSRVGQKMMATGIYATGGIGRSISTTGKIVSSAVRFIAKAQPSGTPVLRAARKPMDARRRLKPHACQYISELKIFADARITSDGGGTFSSPGTT